jgi:hypothetical protein
MPDTPPPSVVPGRSATLLNLVALPVGGVGCLVVAFAISMAMKFVLIPLNATLQGPGGMTGFGYGMTAGLTELVMLAMIGGGAAIQKPIGTPASELFAAGWFLAFAVVLCSAFAQMGG